MCPSDHESAPKDGKSVLHPTVTGEVNSYRRDELGVVNASSQPQVRSAGGFLMLAVVFAGVSVFSVLLVAGPTTRGQDPMWAALFLTAAGVGGVLYAIRRAKVASRAKRLRAERGIPEPSGRQFDW